jgi:cytochrome c oxidase subunit 4
MEHSSPGLRVYFIVYIALIVLLALTIAIAEMHLGGWGIVIALSIASLKALLVLLYFMHLRYSSRLVWVFAISGIVWLMILFFYVLTDYTSRGWVGSSW